MKKISQINEKLKNDKISNMEILNESLIVFKKKPYPKFGNVVILAGGAGCYPKGTEYFNGNEWVHIEDYKDGDILQYDKDSGIASLAKPTDYIDLPTDQFYQIKNRRVDFITSETHKHLLIKEKNGDLVDKSTLELYENDSKRGNRVKLITTFSYDGKGLVLTDDEIRLNIAIFADGHILPTKKPKVRFSFKKQRKIERIRLLLTNNNIEYKEYTENDYTRFDFKYDTKDKEYESYWYNASKEQLSVICDEVLKWDGSNIIRTNRKNSIKFSTTSQKTKDFVQFTFSACGKDVTVYEDVRDGRTLCYELTINNSLGLGIAKNNKAEKTTTISKVNASDRMYCFTTVTGYFIVRQNGKIFVSGNSGKGFIKDNFLGLEGREFDVDHVKTLMLKSDLKKLTQYAKDEFGSDFNVSDLSLGNTKHVSFLHKAEKELGISNSLKNNLFKSVLLAKNKPNIIFDVTLKDVKKLRDLTEKVLDLGYEKENIHIVWVVNDFEVAKQQNAERERQVDIDILTSTHEGAASTMRIITDMGKRLKKYMDGDIWFVFNKRNEDSHFDKSKNGGTNIYFDKVDGQASSVKVHVKESGKPVNKSKLAKTIEKIQEYIPRNINFTY